MNRTQELVERARGILAEQDIDLEVVARELLGHQALARVDKIRDMVARALSEAIREERRVIPEGSEPVDAPPFHWDSYSGSVVAIGEGTHSSFPGAVALMLSRRGKDEVLVKVQQVDRWILFIRFNTWRFAIQESLGEEARDELRKFGSGLGKSFELSRGAPEWLNIPTDWLAAADVKIGKVMDAVRFSDRKHRDRVNGLRAALDQKPSRAEVVEAGYRIQQESDSRKWFIVLAGSVVASRLPSEDAAWDFAIKHLAHGIEWAEATKGAAAEPEPVKLAKGTPGVKIWDVFSGVPMPEPEPPIPDDGVKDPGDPSAIRGPQTWMANDSALVRCVQCSSRDSAFVGSLSDEPIDRIYEDSCSESGGRKIGIRRANECLPVPSWCPKLRITPNR